MIEQLILFVGSTFVNLVTLVIVWNNIEATNSAQQVPWAQAIPKILLSCAYVRFE